MARPRENDEAFFQDALDASPNDSGLRLLFAHWLEQRGDWRAAGYFWMAVYHKAPALDLTRRVEEATWDWWSMLTGWQGHGGDVNNRPDRIPPEIMEGLDGYKKKSHWSDSAYCEFYTRRLAEESLCRVVNRVQPDRTDA